ncbi:DNA polymerase [Fodinibius salinus]|uniref:Type-4 uracil-DNA glycosylase n=1 Tax=Fodinibius salinus TaxID=860790 RepID=A0A5D3YMR2_9BACT|nr:uracil-DNA glycosylase [Fodinibius salinus]TYP95077.1 DNA polymerase [Fodinibius salinus]
MADSSKTTEELIEQIHSFIEQEREIYGDFSTTSFATEERGSENSTSENKESPPPPSPSNSVSEPLEKQTNTPTATAQNSESLDSQEGLFNQDDSNDVYYEIDKCNSLTELESLCQKADVLRTDLDGTQLVFGVGNPNADLMIIGEAPGAEEDKQGEPFVGKAGKLLNKILRAIDFEREDVYIANILKHRPPNNRNPKPEERKRSLPFLLRQIDLVDPKLILGVGKVAVQTLLDKNLSLTKMRGQFHDFRGKYQLLATYHPAALLRHEKWKRPTWEDVQLLRKRYDELGGTP